MLIRSATCPICQRGVEDTALQCPHCGCTVQFVPELPVFSRRDVVEALVQPAIKLTRERINRNPRQGLAHYLLGLCYLNYSFIDRGTAEYQHALTLMPENHTVRFELAMVQLSQGKHASALEQIRQAREYAPEAADYQYLEHYLAGRGAEARGQLETAIRHYIAAYEVGPRWSLAASELRQFVALHEARLTQQGLLQRGDLDRADAELLQLLNADPRAREMELPPPPRAPGQPGPMSMTVLRAVAPTLATRLEELHERRLAEYEAAVLAREQQRQTAIQQLKDEIAEWRMRVRELRADLGAMARLCLAVLEQEERQAGGPSTNGRNNGIGRKLP